MAHYGEKTNGSHYMGFRKIRKKMTAEATPEEVLRDFEAGKYGPPVKEAPKPAPKPAPRPQPTMEDLEESEPAARFRKRMRKMFGGS